MARGYHAIEFLLWGQDLNGIGAGARPASDFDTTHCVGGHCARRAGFLHDGRACTVLEAILWHGGEATAARTAVTALSAPDREHLLAFLTSL